MGVTGVIENELEVAGASYRPARTTMAADWLTLVDRYLESMAAIEKGLGEASQGRQRLGLDIRKSAIFGANSLGLLATALLRLRGVEVVTMGESRAPVLSPHRICGLQGWRHVSMSPTLRHLQLVEELDAHYECFLETTLEAASARVGPFDTILMATGGPFSPLKALDGLGEHGVLVDLTRANMIDLLSIETSPCIVLKSTVTFGSPSDRKYFQWAVKDLSTIELQYPGWLFGLASLPKGDQIRKALLNDSEDQLSRW